MEGNQKYYINYRKKERECSSCKKVLSFEGFTKTSKGTPRSSCKKCRSEEAVETRKEARRKRLEYYSYA